MTDNTQEPLGITEALKILREEQAAYIAAPSGITELPPKEIRRFVAVFQPRSIEGRYLEDERHIEVLANSIGDKPDKPKMLDPIVVWWSGLQWYVIDGHHRLLAYRKRGVKLPVPVITFEGTLDEAVAYSALSNSRDKLPMTLKDKLNMAWRLTLHLRRTKQQVADACAVSARTVATMRKAKSELLAAGVSLEEIPEDWKEAMAEWKGYGHSKDFDPDAAHRMLVEKLAKALKMHLGELMYKHPDAFADAVAYCDDRLPRMMMDTPSWRDDAFDLVKTAEVADLECDY